MHTMSDVEGDPVVVGHDWIQAEPVGARYVRLGGYKGAVTAELVFTRLGWIGTSWLMQPPRTTILAPDKMLEWAVRAVELAEAEGQGSPKWAPLPVQADVGLGLHVLSKPGHPRRLVSMHDGVSRTYLEQFGANGVSLWLVLVNGHLLTDKQGRPELYDDLDTAVYCQEAGDV